MSDHIEVMGGNAQGQLKAFIDRIENVSEDIAGLQADRKDIYAEAKGEGFDVAILKKIVRIRKMDPAKRQEEAALLETYMNALGEAV